MATVIFIVFLMIVVVAVGFFFSVMKTRREREISAAFTRLAAQYDDGELVVDRWSERLVRFTNQGMVFEFEARSLMMSAFDNGVTPNLELRVGWPDKTIKLHIERRRALNVVTAFLGRTRVHSGVDSFDRQFMTTGRPKEDAKEMLQPAISAIFQLNLFLAGGPFEISVDNGAAVIRGGTRRRQYVHLEMFVRLGVAVFEGLSNIATQGVDFVEADGASNVDEAICRICGDPLDQIIVQCASCKTLHHHECWNYAGGCSTYGCGQTKYLAVPAPAPNQHEPIDS